MPYAPKTHRTTSPNAMREYRKRYDETRGTSYQRGYDGVWKRVRLEHLQNNPLCVDCLKRYIFTPAAECHHIVKVAEHPELRDVAGNIISLCKSCHSKRTSAGE